MSYITLLNTLSLERYTKGIKGNTWMRLEKRESGGTVFNITLPRKARKGNRKQEEDGRGMKGKRKRKSEINEVRKNRSFVSLFPHGQPIMGEDERQRED